MDISAAAAAPHVTESPTPPQLAAESVSMEHSAGAGQLAGGIARQVEDIAAQRPDLAALAANIGTPATTALEERRSALHARQETSEQFAGRLTADDREAVTRLEHAAKLGFRELDAAICVN